MIEFIRAFRHIYKLPKEMRSDVYDCIYKFYAESSDCYKNLNKDQFEALKKTQKEWNLLNDSDIDFDKLLKLINDSFNKNIKKIPENQRSKYIIMLRKGLVTKEDIHKAILNAKSNPHPDKGYTYFTPEFFSRVDKVQYYSNIDAIKKNEQRINEMQISPTN